MILLAIVGIGLLIGFVKKFSPENVYDKFNEFATYLEDTPEGGVLYGEHDQVQTYLQTAWQKFNEFYSLYNSEYKNSSEAPDALIKNYYYNFDLVYHVYRQPNLTSTQLLDAYKDISGNTAQQLRAYYRDFLESPSGITRAYGENYISAGETLLDAYRTLLSYGCIDENEFLNLCANLPENLQYANNAILDFQNFYLEATAQCKNATDSLFQNLTEIKEELPK